MENELDFDITADELDIFLADVNDCIQSMETGILHLEKKHDAETLNTIFRAAHTLKAVAGTVGHHSMAELTHTLENIFDAMREGKLSPTLTVADDLLTTVDILKALRDEIVTRQPSGLDLAPLITQLQAIIRADNQKQSHDGTPVRYQLRPEQISQLKSLDEAGETVLEVEITTAPQAFASAARLYQAAIVLMEIGQLVAQNPALDALSEQNEQLWVLLATEVDSAEITKLLGEVEDIDQIHIQSFQLPDLDIVPSSLIDEAAGDKQSSAKSDFDFSPDKSVRISVERLDALMNLVGELVTNRARLMQIEDILQAQYGKGNGVGALTDMTAHFNHIVDQLQEEVMRARMLPISSLFNKFPRLVRNLARPAGKQVNLIIEGEATELDRAVIYAIGDPLIHLLRNAMDHGLETPAQRQAAGKPPLGTIFLSAASVEGQIVITVTDDGQGIDPLQVRQAALKNELISEDELAQMAEDEIIDLIFRPKLSTAAEVTEVSGRGVGLDVVRSNIEQLSGSVVVTSQSGQGSTFRLTLPLTLALIRTMLVVVRNNLYAIPVAGINGALYQAEASRSSVKGNPAFDWQGAVVPLLDLGKFFDHPRLPKVSQNNIKPSIVVVTWGKLKVGLVVDKIIGQQEIVVKSLSSMLGQVAGLSGATILGDGRIALIIDIPNLINTALQARRQGVL